FYNFPWNHVYWVRQSMKTEPAEGLHGRVKPGSGLLKKGFYFMEGRLPSGKDTLRRATKAVSPERSCSGQGLPVSPLATGTGAGIQEMAEKRQKSLGLYEKIYAVVLRIPWGRVASYGQVARNVRGCTPRWVGYAMAAVPEGSGIPWQRVINSQGKISDRNRGDGALCQRELLEAEGICFDEKGRVDFDRFGWEGLDPLQERPIS
ncbi:MAG: MGMT family protein, partial [Planctomycetota bacterium]